MIGKNVFIKFIIFISFRLGTKRYENIFSELIFLYNSSYKGLGILQITGR